MPEILQVTLPARQNGSVDCGLFAITYATDLTIGNDPVEIIYDQCEIRNHLLDCLQSNKIQPCPRKQEVRNSLLILLIT